MKLTLTLTAAAAVGAFLTISAGAMARSGTTDGPGALAAAGFEALDHRPIILASDDDRENHKYRKHGRAGDEGESSDEEDDDDDDDGGGVTVNPVSAGTVAPPANGLFAPGYPLGFR